MGAVPSHMELELQHGSMVGVPAVLLLILLSISGFAKLAEETLIKRHGCDKVPGQPISFLSHPRLHCLSKGG